MVGGGRRSPPPKEEGGGKTRSGSARRERPKAGGELAQGGGNGGSGGVLDAGLKSGGADSPGDGQLGSCSTGGTAGDGNKMAAVVHAKASVKPSDGARMVALGGAIFGGSFSGNGGAAGGCFSSPGSVQHLMAKFGTSTNCKTKWADQLMHSSAADVQHGRSWADQMEATREVVLEDRNGSSGKTSREVVSNIAGSCVMDSRTVDSHEEAAMEEESDPQHCSPGVCDNAPDGSKVCILALEGTPMGMNVCEDVGFVGDRLMKGWSDSGLQGGSTHNDANMTDQPNLEDCTQGARAYAPTMADVENSLRLAGHISQHPLEGIGNTPWAGAAQNDQVMGEAQVAMASPASVVARTGLNSSPLGGAVSRRADLGRNTQGDNAWNIPIHQRSAPLGKDGRPNAWKKVAPVKFSSNLKKEDVTEDGTTVDLNLAQVHSNAQRLRKALVGTLLGRRIPFHFLEVELKRRWLQFGEFHLMATGPDSFMCLFEDEAARDAVLMGGPWFVAGQIIGMDRWSLSASPSSLAGMTAPVWIRMKGLPVVYWDEENLFRIALMLGEPLWVDGHTSSWGCGGYARVCVKIDLSKRLVPGIHINGADGRFYQPVEYEGISLMCFICGLAGHKDTTCPTVVRRGNVVGHPPPSVPLPRIPMQQQSLKQPSPTPQGVAQPEPVFAGKCKVAEIGESSGSPLLDASGEVLDKGEGTLGPWMLVHYKKTKQVARNIPKGKPKGVQPPLGHDDGGQVRRQPPARNGNGKAVDAPPILHMAVQPPNKTIQASPRLGQSKDSRLQPPAVLGQGITCTFSSSSSLGQGQNCCTMDSSGLGQDTNSSIPTSPGIGQAGDSTLGDGIQVFSATGGQHSNKGGGRARVGKTRASNTSLDKQLSMLGNLANQSRKRRKGSIDFTDGGVASPSVDQ